MSGTHPTHFGRVWLGLTSVVGSKFLVIPIVFAFAQIGSSLGAPGGVPGLLLLAAATAAAYLLVLRPAASAIGAWAGVDPDAAPTEPAWIVLMPVALVGIAIAVGERDRWLMALFVGSFIVALLGWTYVRARRLARGAPAPSARSVGET